LSSTPIAIIEVIFWFVLVHFETNLFVSVFQNTFKTPKQTETNRNKIFIGFENELKQTRNRSCFIYFRFEPKNCFICFCGHPNIHSCKTQLKKQPASDVTVVININIVHTGVGYSKKIS